MSGSSISISHYKKKLLKSGALTVVLLGVSACGTTLRHYNNASYDYASNCEEGCVHGDVGLEGFAEEVPTQRAVRQLIDLGPEGQAALIQRHEKNGAFDVAALAADLARTIRRSETPTGIRTDRSLVEARQRLILTLFTEKLRPADRITEAKIKIEPPDGWRFTGWDGATVVHNTIRVATVVDEFNRSGSANFTFDTLTPDLASAELGGDIARNEQVTQNIDVEVVEFLPSIQPTHATLRLNAPFAQTNVAGTYAINFSMQAKNQFFAHTFDFTEKPNREGALGVTNRYFQGEVVTDDIETLADNRYAIRHMPTELSYIVRKTNDKRKKRQRSVKESDDKVTFKENAFEQNQANEPGDIPIVINSPEFYVWSIEYLNANGSIEPLRIDPQKHDGADVSAAGPQCAFFENDQEAEKFVHWLNKRSPFDAKGLHPYKSNDKKNEFTVIGPKNTKLQGRYSLAPHKIFHLKEVPVVLGTKKYTPVLGDNDIHRNCLIDSDF